MNILLILTAAFIFSSFLYATIISIYEKEYPAAKKFAFIALILPLPYLLIGLLDYNFHQESGIILFGLTIVFLIILIFPYGRNKNYRQSKPLLRIDERDTMFSRNELVEGSENYNDYYKRNPDKLVIDNYWRKKPGLLNPGSSQYNPFQFASAKASFETIKALHGKVDGIVNPEKANSEIEQITRYIKNWSKKLGAVDVGITELKDYHLYSVGGRAERYGKEFTRKHKYAIAMTVEMDKEMVASSPSGTIVMESGQQYLESGKIAIQIGEFIRKLGYEARAHVDGNYEVVCPLIARDAGLGDIGRMGLLMTPKLGPRVRIAVVTTNLPLTIDPPKPDFPMIDFCIKCKKCADTCPGQAISFENMKEVDGVKRWQINQEACFTTWAIAGTDCGRCISVCPFAHENNFMHNIVRAGIQNSSIFRTFALTLDDFIYGEKPPPAKIPEWADISEKK